MQLVLILLMFAVATVFSMLGQGGGVLYTPIQVWWGIDFHVAAATSLFLIMCTSLSASLVYRRARKIDWPLALVLESATMLGGFAGGLWSSRFTGDALSAFFAGFVTVAGVLMIRRVELTAAPPVRPASWWRWRRVMDERPYSVHLGLALPVSFLAGLVSGMVGVGGGILKVPMMVLLFGVPIDIAVGSSAMMVGLTAAAGFVGHATSGHWEWRTSLALAVAVILGGQLGSRMSIRMDKAILKRRLGWFLLAVAAVMLLRVWMT